MCVLYIPEARTDIAVSDLYIIGIRADIPVCILYIPGARMDIRERYFCIRVMMPDIPGCGLDILGCGLDILAEQMEMAVKAGLAGDEQDLVCYQLLVVTQFEVVKSFDSSCRRQEISLSNDTVSML